MDPPVATVELNFFLAGFVTVVLFRKLVHLDDHLFSASVVDHCLSEGLVADVPVVDAIVFPFTAFLCKLGILCILELFHTCDHVVCLFYCRSSVWRNESRVDEMYFRFSAESVVIRRPHTQYMTPGLQ